LSVSCRAMNPTDAVVMSKPMRGAALQKFIRLLHSYSSMLVLVLLLFFAVTGITLNHPDSLYSSAGKYSRQQTLSLPAQFLLTELPQAEHEQAQLADQLRAWLRQEHDVKGSEFSYLFEPEELLLEMDFKRPAGYASVIVDFNEHTAELDMEFGGYLA